MPTLSVCMIVRDEAYQLAEILGQCQSFADEIVVVDTGSVDNTKEVARRFTDKVFEFPWCDDFSAARNHSIGKAASDYIFIVDADDRINAANQRLICQLKSHFDGKRAFQCLLTCKTSDGDSAPRLKVRCFPNRRHIYYQDTIHEGLWDSLIKAGVEIKQTNIGIVHVGYMDKKLLLKKRTRNLLLLKETVKDNPLDAKANYYLGQLSEGMQHYDDANRYYRVGLPYMESVAEKQTLFLYELLMGLIRVNQQLGDKAAVKKYFKKLCKHSKDLPPGIIDICAVAEQGGLYDRVYAEHQHSC